MSEAFRLLACCISTFVFIYRHLEVSCTKTVWHHKRRDLQTSALTCSNVKISVCHFLRSDIFRLKAWDLVYADTQHGQNYLDTQHPLQICDLLLQQPSPLWSESLLQTLCRVRTAEHLWGLCSGLVSDWFEVKTLRTSQVLQKHFFKELLRAQLVSTGWNTEDTNTLLTES